MKVSHQVRQIKKFPSARESALTGCKYEFILPGAGDRAALTRFIESAKPSGLAGCRLALLFDVHIEGNSCDLPVQVESLHFASYSLLPCRSALATFVSLTMRPSTRCNSSTIRKAGPSV